MLAYLLNEKVIDDEEFNQFIMLTQQETAQNLTDDFLHLFEGCDVMHAPPWGSVYLDREQVIFGDSTLTYRQFLTQNAIELNTGMREPEDQFGLMLMAISQLIEKNKDEAALTTLLSEHLFTWAYRYLDLVELSAQTASYRALAKLTREWCLEVQDELSITPAVVKVYR